MDPINQSEPIAGSGQRQLFSKCQGCRMERASPAGKGKGWLMANAPVLLRDEHQSRLPALVLNLSRRCALRGDSIATARPVAEAVSKAGQASQPLTLQSPLLALEGPSQPVLGNMAIASFQIPKPKPREPKSVAQRYRPDSYFPCDWAEYPTSTS